MDYKITLMFLTIANLSIQALLLIGYLYQVDALSVVNMAYVAVIGICFSGFCLFFHWFLKKSSQTRSFLKALAFNAFHLCAFSVSTFFFYLCLYQIYIVGNEMI